MDKVGAVLYHGGRSVVAVVALLTFLKIALYTEGVVVPIGLQYLGWGLLIGAALWGCGWALRAAVSMREVADDL